MRKLNKFNEKPNLVQKKRSSIDEIRINSIPDFNFPFSSQLIRSTFDNKFLFATGTYPPQIKCFSLENLNLRFQ